ncbi:leucine-rich repeat protein 1-like isoform X2 [Python bivittatus]|uniref:Leucine-rich repeat protein 1-like isoform X2 n=1 Tax=Python bivittatus TaxID=176946 RepID=A0A9F2WHX6_PYTBI|nr:leucine-rich repeat protein 1-like isoform X2 [Python bivittatus]
MPLRLTCDVSVVRRSEPSAEGRPSERPLRARLSLRKPPKGRRGSACVLINTDPHRGSTKYKLRENIEEVFCDIKKRKATIRLKEPEVDLCLITGEIKQLKSFMSAVMQGYQGSKQECLPGPNLSPTKKV